MTRHDSGHRNFTERARAALGLAHDIAREGGHGAVTPEHIALGILRHGDGVAVTALRFHGVPLEPVEKEIVEQLGTLAAQSTEREPLLDARASKLLRDAAAVSGELDHRYVGTEHLLLALLRDTDGTVARVLGRHGFGFNDAKARILWMLTTDTQNPSPFVPPSAV